MGAGARGSRPGGLAKRPAAELLGAAEALRETLGISLEGAELLLHQRATAAIEGALTPEAAAAHWAAGRDLPPEQAVDQALAAGESHAARIG